ncbi:MAG: hypothetical protein V4753_16850 [Pseudomonadota bacterium]
MLFLPILILPILILPIQILTVRVADAVVVAQDGSSGLPTGFPAAAPDPVGVVGRKDGFDCGMARSLPVPRNDA